MFPVLLHPDLYQRLRQSERGERARVWKTLLRLREGRWGGGTRVKRLRGIGRPVYEARTDSGDRLLFTMARSADPDRPDRLTSHLQIWDLVEHDDAERTARRNRAPEAEFLELEALEEIEIFEPPPHPEALFSEIPEDDPSDASEPLLRFLLPPEGFAPEGEEAIAGGVRWFVLGSSAQAEEELQRLLDAGGEELELKLNREQYEILRTPGPVLLAGSAGSGKTTVAVHRLVAAACAPEAPSALYLSYSPALVEHARSLYHDLAVARGVDPDLRRPDFFTFGDLYRSLVPRDFREHQARPMTEALFREWFRKFSRSLDAALVWEELRSILKGACLAPGQPMLDEETYFELGRKRAPLFVDERPEIYRIAQRYQEWLAKDGRSDRIDLCRQALAEMRRRKHNKGYDVVVCDEVQDLTELEVAFVLSLSRRQDLAGILMTGDTQQIVNPSGFRWAEVRRLAGKAAHAKTAPNVLRLRRNLRSVRPLVELANALLLLRREVFGRSEEDEPEEAVIEGPVPIEVTAPEEEVLAAIRSFGPRCAVLTLDDEEAERLRRELDTHRVFHVREAKGLEFESVVLWKLLEPDHDLVDRFVRASREADRLEREARFKRLLQHLYVGVTRARRHLAVYEGLTPHPFWSDERLRGRIEHDTVEGLGRLFQPTASPAEWEQEGDYFYQRGHFRQAAECYRRAARAEKETEALAQAEEELEHWSQALELWNRLGVPARQAPLLEKLGRLSEALPLYRQAGMDWEARFCELRLLERAQEWSAAALGWEAEGQHADAARCWARSGEERRALAAAARAAEETESWSRAGEIWLDLGQPEDAVRCFRAAGDRARIAFALAQQLEAEGLWGRAAAAWRLAGRREASLRCRARAHEAAGRPERAARIWERVGETERAVDLYVQAGAWAEVARLERPQGMEKLRLPAHIQELVEAGSWREATRLADLRIEVLGPHLPEVRWFAAGQEQRLAEQELQAIRLLRKRCEGMQAEAAGSWSRAVRCWVEAGDAERAWMALQRRIEGVRDPMRRARAYATMGEVERAIEALQAASGPGESRAPEALRALEAWNAEQEGQYREAARMWSLLGRTRDEWRCLAQAVKVGGEPAGLPASGQEPPAVLDEVGANRPTPGDGEV